MAATAIATPVAGDVVLSSWGAQVAAAHNGIQAGSVNVSGTTQSGSAAVVFPRPYAAPPIVVAVQASGALTHFAVVTAITASGFTALLEHRDGTASTFGPIAVAWVAIGVPA